MYVQCATIDINLIFMIQISLTTIDYDSFFYNVIYNVIMIFIIINFSVVKISSAYLCEGNFYFCLVFLIK
jgi:hypothetical protein